ncbi:MAG: AMP-binding protein [Parachlamydiales bacterium]|nr:AMP-binding protein [Parachlamydiales bacterium]
MPERPALWDLSEGTTSFGQIYQYAAHMQTLARSHGIKKGDYALIFGKPGSALYAAVIGLLGLGCSAIFIEPWMALSEIEAIIAQTKPKIYITNFIGKLWGARMKAIRKIPVWISLYRIKNNNGSKNLAAIPLSEDHVGFITFTTGTTGHSKGVVRTHGVLFHQATVLSKYLSTHGTDLCVLPNFVFLNLSLGKCSVFVSINDHRRKWQKIPEQLRPSSISCGPGFLQKLIENADCFPDLSSFHIGGALAPCALYEKGFEKWPFARWIQIYGSSEAEPVSIADAREVVKKCRLKSYHQSLYLGAPISEIQTCIDEGVLWVLGDHVSPFYFGHHEANQTHKKKDAEHRLWHNMGDRIYPDDEGWWYQGRSSQPLSDFILEQQISSFLKTDALLVANHQFLLGAGVEIHREALLKRFPVLTDVIECKVYRDRRHRARIDREKTIKKGAPWVAG